MKKGIALCLAMVMMLCCGAAQALTLAGVEVSEGIVWEESRFFDYMEEAVGAELTVQQFTSAEEWKAAKAAMAEGTAQLPDMLFKANLTPLEEQQLLDAGAIIDLAPLLEQYAPNLWKILQARPEWRKDISLADGRIASLPAISGAERQCCIWLCEDWLEALELPVPDTIDEFTQTLRAFRDQDPNQNGKNDEVPLSVCGPWEAKFLLHAWGIAANDYNLFVRDGEVVFAPFEPEYRQFVQWLKTALEEGLIEEETFRVSNGARGTTLSLQQQDEKAPITIGSLVTIAPYTLISMDDTQSYIALKPLEYEGGRVFRELIPAVSRGAFAVTSACQDVEAALRFVDYLYTEEGGRIAYAGKEGTDYILQPDGSWKWNIGTDYSALTTLVKGCVISGDGLTPGLEPAAFVRNGEIADDNYARRQTDGLREYFTAPVPLTRPVDAQSEARIAQLQQELAICVDTAIANFAMGIIPLDDANWDAFLQQLSSQGAEEFIALWQAKVDALQ